MIFKSTFLRRIFGGKNQLASGFKRGKETPSSFTIRLRKIGRGPIFIQSRGGNQTLTSSKDIRQSAVNFFKGFFGGWNFYFHPENLEFLDKMISKEEANALCVVPTMDEIKSVLFSMHPDSVAGSDGFSAKFYQHCWEMIKCDLLELYLEFFSGLPMPISFTATTVVLLPKHEGPKQWADFRPINLCNVINKIISKIVCSRLALFLDKIICPSQNGFVPKRYIYDNILLAQELTHSLDMKCKDGNMLLKLDMTKAYDRLQWQFLYAVLSKLGFSDQWIALVKNCIQNS